MTPKQQHDCRLFCETCPLSRRSFLAGGLALGSLPVLPQSSPTNTSRQQPVRLPLTVQPVLVYETYQKKEATSWRPWGGLLTEADVAQEKERIGKELSEAGSKADFPLKFLPLAIAQQPEQAASIASGNYDVILSYAAGGSVKTLEALTAPGKQHVMFLRHRSGPVYLWYEIVHPRFLRKTVDDFGQSGMSIEDVVVDRYDEVFVRLRALYGLKNALGKRIVSLGKPGGWGAGGRLAPDRAREIWKLDIQTASYEDLGRRIQLARDDGALVKRSQAAADNYLKQKDVTLGTAREFVYNAFLLAEVFHDLLDEAGTDAFTINNCMTTIMPVSKTTACMPLSLLNDDGYMAFCESDFVVIPAGILLHYISGKPVFLNDPTFPHDGVVTLAHCTAPRKMDGMHPEPVKILTHFESDYGAAPKVEMRIGQDVTNLIPDFSGKRCVGVAGEIIDHPFMNICRSQIDVRLHGDTSRLLEQMRGFHWITCYGNYLRETRYALKKLGVDWVVVT